LEDDVVMNNKEIIIGQTGTYGFFSNVTVVNINENTVTIQDKLNNQKTVYKELFKKHFKPNV